MGHEHGPGRADMHIALLPLLCDNVPAPSARLHVHSRSYSTVVALISNSAHLTWQQQLARVLVPGLRLLRWYVYVNTNVCMLFQGV